MFATPEAMDRYTLCLRSTHIGDIELHSLSIVLEDPSEVEAKVLAFFLASNADYSLHGFPNPRQQRCGYSKNWTMKSTLETCPKNRTLNIP